MASSARPGDPFFRSHAAHGGLAAVLALLALLAGLGAGTPAAAAAPPRILIVNDETRIRRGDRAAAEAEQAAVATRGGALALAALRGETVSFQVIVLGAEPLEGGSQPPAMDLVLAVAPFAPAAALQVSLFTQFYVPVRERSRNEHRPAESLGWLPAARAPDADVLGEVPDALIPLGAGAPAPAPPPGATPAWQAFWVDLFIPDDAAAGVYRSTLTVTAPGAAPQVREIAVEVGAARLPFRATSVFAYYEPQRLDRRIGDGAAVERQLWQLLHEHHVDALPPLTSAADVDRLAAAFDGRWFGAAQGYHGPGPGQGPAVTALGAYGQLGDPSAEARTTALAMADRLGKLGPGLDVFLYAVDEQCDSPRAAAWKSALNGGAAATALHVGQTCARPPDQQAADVAWIPGPSFARAMPATAAAAGRRAWAYNGALPQTGTLLLDADPRGLIANGWIAALADIERWFYWETTFWDDDNRGGRGAIDPFVTPVNFHNRDGDTALGDGLLLYPGRQQGKRAGVSFGVAGVFPSLRLKMIRRGIQDAGYLVLAARENLPETLRIAAGALPAVLDEAATEQAASWTAAAAGGSGPRFGTARAALRTLITRADPLSAGEAPRLYRALGAGRRAAIPPALSRRQRLARRGAAVLVAAVVLAAVGLVIVRTHRRARGQLGGLVRK